MHGSCFAYLRCTRRTDALSARGVSKVQVIPEESRALYTAMGIISRLLALDDALGRLGDNIARWILISVYLHVLSKPLQ